MSCLAELRTQGFNLVLTAADKFSVTPASALTPNQRDFLRSHKAEILNELSGKHTGDESPAPSASSALTRVATSTVTSTSPENGGFGADQNSDLSPVDRKTLHDYLALIGETDDDMIAEFLAECANDPAILAAQLQQARDEIKVAKGDTSDFTRCIGCKHLTGNTCQKYQARVIVNKWRRCETGKALEHFSSLSKELH